MIVKWWTILKISSTERQCYYLLARRRIRLRLEFIFIKTFLISRKLINPKERRKHLTHWLKFHTFSATCCCSAAHLEDINASNTMQQNTGATMKMVCYNRANDTLSIERKLCTRETNNFIILIGIACLRICHPICNAIYLCLLFIVGQPQNDKTPFKWRKEVTLTTTHLRSCLCVCWCKLAIRLKPCLK